MHRRCISNPLPGCKHRAYGAAQHLPCPSVVVPTRLHPRPSPVSVTTPSVGTAQTTQAPSQTNGAPKEPASQPVSAAAVQGPPSPQPAAPPPPPAPSVATNSEPPPPITTQSGFQLKAIHVVMFSLIFVGGAVFATLTLQLTVGMEFSTAISTVLRRVAKSVAFRQLVVISLAILVLRYGMNNFLMTLSKFSSSPVQWDKTKLYYILKEVYQPMELLLFIAALCTVADAYVPSLIGVPKATVQHVVKSILSTSFILGFASVVFNLKSRFCKENAWQAEMKGDVTTQRRWEAYDKLGTFVIYVMSFVLGIQALGLEVTSVLAIGGIGGLAIGLAGREICENLLNGFLIMSTNPFEVGDEITFFHNNKVVEGFVIDIGWYRTNVRSFEREVYVIPNAVFSKNIVLNVSRKNREWRFYEMLSIRVQDVQKANAVVQDIRRIVRNDTRVINKLHRRVFLDKITPEDAKIYMSFYLEAANRDAFMAIKQDLLVSFVDCVERNGAKLATPRTVVDLDPEMTDVLSNVGPLVQGMSAYAMAQNMSAAAAAGGGPGGIPGMRALPAPGTIINAEATPVTVTASTSNSSSSASQQGSPSPSQPATVSQPAAAAQPALSHQAQPSSQPAAAVAAAPGSTNGSPPAAAGSQPQPGQGGAGGAGAVNGKAVPSVGAAGGVAVAAATASSSGSQSSGTRVGEVFTAPQSTVVMSVPATGVPVAFAGAVTNNVVSTGANRPPLSASSSSSGTSSGTGGITGSTGAPGSQGLASGTAALNGGAGGTAAAAGTGAQATGPNGEKSGNFLEHILRTVASLVFESP